MPQQSSQVDFAPHALEVLTADGERSTQLVGVWAAKRIGALGRVAANVRSRGARRAVRRSRIKGGCDPVYSFIGRPPNCSRSPSSSRVAQCSASLPSAIRKMWMC